MMETLMTAQNPEDLKNKTITEDFRKEKIGFSPAASFFYNLAYGAFGLFYLPIFLKKSKQAVDPKTLWDQRRGYFSEDLKQKLTGKNLVWIHAVSVGEVMAVKKFIDDFLTESSSHILLTTVTPTGQKIAKELEGERLSAVYFPFDFSSACRRFFESFSPQLLLLAETEIWPNVLIQARRFQVPVGILNARLSEKSFKRYAQFKKFFRPFFHGLEFVLAQTEADAERFLKLGVPQNRVRVAGNMKFDNVHLEPVSPQAARSLKQEWGFNDTEMIWVAGSTHPHEEEIVIRAFCHLRCEFPRLKLIIAPRHIERSGQLLAQIKKQSLRGTLAAERTGQEAFDVLILNRLGILKSLYQIADVVYVGGSLTKRGGQNPIEPASFKKPIVHGPHTFNFEKIYRELDQEGAARAVESEAQLIFAVERLLKNEAERIAMGEKAYQKVNSLRGATRRHLDCVGQFLGLRAQERIRDGSNDSKLFPPSGGRL